MMTNLFTVFDPSSSILFLPMNWLSTFIGLFLIPNLFWTMPSRWSLLWNKINITLYKEFNTLLKSNMKSFPFMFISLFSIIVFNNFLGLIPYIFTSTSHLIMTLTLSLPMWISFMIYGWINNTQYMFAHLVPQGTPTILMPFMVLIETISNMIRPGTLAIRLTANMMAGHLLLNLLGNNGPNLTNFFLIFLIFSQILLLTLEATVAIIQSYVFSILSMLYVAEI
uniref:ATP synthase subunit a n=1 Tax=Spongiocaris panglao TaxID=1986577 RepID=A0A345F0M3_9EUCA|nr:ATP synthase F0 subunit 6 [Spongiocaris panglao]AXG21498.1 ATP synthase F0 subunit 6 [Spongiocaris panglao]